jgi:hypothetical protein
LQAAEIAVSVAAAYVPGSLASLFMKVYAHAGVVAAVDHAVALTERHTFGVPAWQKWSTAQSAVVAGDAHEQAAVLAVSAVLVVLILHVAGRPVVWQSPAPVSSAHQLPAAQTSAPHLHMFGCAGSPAWFGSRAVVAVAGVSEMQVAIAPQFTSGTLRHRLSLWQYFPSAQSVTPMPEAQMQPPGMVMGLSVWAAAHSLSRPGWPASGFVAQRWQSLVAVLYSYPSAQDADSYSVQVQEAGELDQAPALQVPASGAVTLTATGAPVALMLRIPSWIAAPTVGVTVRADSTHICHEAICQVIGVISGNLAITRHLKP